MSETYMTMIMKYVEFSDRNIVSHDLVVISVSAKHFNKCKVLGKN